MEEKIQFQEKEDGSRREPARAERGGRALLLMRAAGALRVAVFADETDSVNEGLKPVPLPHAPPAVLGLVCVRGRMRTVLDPSLLLASQRQAHTDAEPNSNTSEASAANGATTDATPTTDALLTGDTTTPTGDDNAQTHAPNNAHVIVALRGDEQLALAVRSIERTREISPEAIQPLPHSGNLLRGTLADDDTLFILNPAHLFDAAMQGTERRRRR
ncbi:MAG TPA: chemotaxis protein CheW [Pyrinomonadaceae bacterium]|jgi:chemotaxis signal transduction protein|nr:chemotaxis protein CheW [Pyrinomonadaceae bacterium]